MAIEIGAPAPPFRLLDQDGAEWTPEDLRGSIVLLVFIPFPFTAVCEGELCQLRDRQSELESVGARVVVITCDTRFANRRWAAEQSFRFPILSDFWPHGEVCRAYGSFIELLGCSTRTTFVIDREGIVRGVVTNGVSVHRVTQQSLEIPRSFADYQRELAALPAE